MVNSDRPNPTEPHSQYIVIKKHGGGIPTSDEISNLVNINPPQPQQNNFMPNSPGPPDAMGIDRDHTDINFQAEQYRELERLGIRVKPKGYHDRKAEE